MGQVSCDVFRSSETDSHENIEEDYGRQDESKMLKECLDCGLGKRAIQLLRFSSCWYRQLRTPSNISEPS